jgi:hypothetical protein
MPRSVRAGVLASTVVWLVSCSSPTDPSATTAKVDLVANPSPTSALPSSGVTYTIVGDATHPDQTKEYPWRTHFSVNMAETAGVGLDITSISVKVQQAAGGIITPPTNGQIEHYQFTSQSSGNRLEGHGTTVVGFDVWYALPNQGREAVVTVIVTFLDKKDVSNLTDDISFTNQVTVTVQ